MTSDTPAVRDKFKPGRDLIVSSSPKETLEKVKYYLNHDSERKKIQINGKKAVKNDSYRHRAERMLEVLKSRGIIRNLGETIHYVDVLKEKYVIHHVTPGETLSIIARKYNDSCSNSWSLIISNQIKYMLDKSLRLERNCLEILITNFSKGE